MTSPNPATNPSSPIDEEKLEECISILVAAGYHRARVKELDNYDKIVGGIVWCLSKCRIITKLDLLYQENSSIKQRIMSTEVIVKALNLMRCPTKIEPHQIQGLDYDHIYPVIQWLIHSAMQIEVSGDRMACFSEWFSKFDKEDTSSKIVRAQARKEFVTRLRNVTDIHSPTMRGFKRIDGVKTFDFDHDVKCTIAEYIKEATDGGSIFNSKVVEDDEMDVLSDDGEPCSSSLQESSAKHRVSTKVVRELMEGAIAEVYKNETSHDRDMRLQVEHLIEEHEIQKTILELEKMIEQDAIEYLTTNAENKSRTQKNAELDSKFKNPENSEKVKEATELLTRCTEARDRLKVLRDNAMADLNEIHDRVTAARMNIDENGVTRKYDPKYREALEALDQERTRRAKSTIRLIALQQKVQKYISDTLKAQYTTREMEGANDVLALTNETKVVLIGHNTAVDILNFSTKVLSFTNQIEELILRDEQMSENYRAAFFNYMNDVRSQMAEYHWKGKVTQERMVEEKRQLLNKTGELTRAKRAVEEASNSVNQVVSINQKLVILTSIIDQLEIN